MQAAHLQRMLCTKRCTLSCGSLSHSSTRNLLRSARVLLTFRHAWTALPNWSHTCSMGFKSGEHAGQWILVICCCCRYASTILTRWGRALSSWSNALGSMIWPSLGVCRPVHYALPYFATLSFDHRSSLSRTAIHPRTACSPLVPVPATSVSAWVISCHETTALFNDSSPV